MTYIAGFGSGFQLSVKHPIDKRYEVLDITNAPAEYLATAYPGLITYDKATSSSMLVTANGGTQASLEYITLAAVDAGTVIYSATETYTLGAIVQHLDVKYENIVAVTVPEAFDAAKWKRLTAQTFTGIENSKRYVPGDTFETTSFTLRVLNEFTSTASATFRDAVVTANVTLLSSVDYVDLAAADTITFHDFQRKGDVWVVAEANTVAFADTTLDAGDRLVLKADADSTMTAAFTDFYRYGQKSDVGVFPDFVQGESYALGDKVVFERRLWSRNAAARPANAPFSADHWSALEYHTYPPRIFYGHDAARVYAADDILIAQGRKYYFRTSYDMPVVLDTTDPLIVDIMSKTYTEYLEDTGFYAGDQFVVDNVTSLVTSAFMIDSGAGETIDNHTDKLMVVNDDTFSALRDYVNGGSLEAKSLFVYDGGVYYTAIVVDGSDTATDTWDKIKNSVSLVGKIEPQIPEFDPTLTYATGTKITYKDFVWTRNANATRVADDPFSIVHFDRFIPAGHVFSAFVAGPYLAGDVVKQGDEEFVANNDMDNATAFVAGSDADQFNRKTKRVYEAWPVLETVFIKGDIIIGGNRTFYVKSGFTADAGETAETYSVNLLLMSDDTTSQVRNYEDGDSFDANELLKYTDGLYFVDTGWTADVLGGVNHVWAAVSDKCSLISSVTDTTASDFDKDATYAENDRVKFDDYIFTRNATARSAGDEFSLTHFVRLITGGARRDLTTAKHLLAGDLVNDGGKEYRVNADVDYDAGLVGQIVLTEGVTGDNTYTRIRSEVFNSLTPSKMYIKGDMIRTGRRTYVVTSAFISAAVDPELSTQSGAVLTADDFNVLHPNYMAEVQLDVGMTFKHEQALWFVHTQVLEGDNTDLDAIKDNLTLIAKAPVAAASAFDPAVDYVDGDRVTYQGYAWKRNAAPRTAPAPFSLVDFDRELAAPQTLGALTLPANAVAFYAGDTFTVDGITYIALANKDAGTDLAITPTTVDRLSVMEFVTIPKNTQFIVGDTFKLHARYDLRVHTGFVSADPAGDLTEDDIKANVNAINIVTTFYLDDVSEIVYHDYMSRGHRWIVTANNTVALPGFTIDEGFILYLKADKTAADTPTYGDFWFQDPDELLKAAVPFDASSTYGEYDRVIYRDFVYRVINPARVAGTDFTDEDFHRELPGGEFVGDLDEGTVFYTGDRFTYQGILYVATANKDNGMSEQFAMFASDRLTPQIFTGLNDAVLSRVYIVGDTVVLDNYSIHVDTAFQSSKPGTEAELLANGTVVDVEREYFLSPTDVIAYHDYNKAGHRWFLAEDSTDAIAGETLQAGNLLVLRSDKTAADTPTLDDFFVYKTDNTVPIVPFVSSNIYNEGDLVSLDGIIYKRNTFNAGATTTILNGFTRESPAGTEITNTQPTYGRFLAGDYLVGPYFNVVLINNVTRNNTTGPFFSVDYKLVGDGRKAEIGATVDLDLSFGIPQGMEYYVSSTRNGYLGRDWPSGETGIFVMTLPPNLWLGQSSYRIFTTKTYAEPVVQATYSGSVQPLNPGAVVSPDGEFSINDTAIINWSGSVGSLDDIDSILSVTVNGTDRTSEFTLGSTPKLIKIKASSTLELWADDAIIVSLVHV